MVRLRCRLTEDELRTVDFYCELFGLTRSEYMHRVVTGEPLRPAALEAAMRGEATAARLRRAPVAREPRRHHVMLALGREGRASLLSCASSEGVSVSEYVARHTTVLETYFGDDADASATTEGLSRAADGLGALGLVLNDLARSANTMAMIARKQGEGDEADMERCANRAWRDVEDLPAYEGRVRAAVGALESYWRGDGGEGEGGETVALGDGNGHGGGGGEGAQAGAGGRPRAGGVAQVRAAGPGDGGGKARTVTVSLSETEVQILDGAALYSGLTRSQWVLVSCTPLYPGWVAVDTYEVARIETELGHQVANVGQALRALDALGADYSDLAREAHEGTGALLALAARGRAVARSLVVRGRAVLPVD